MVTFKWTCTQSPHYLHVTTHVHEPWALSRPPAGLCPPAWVPGSQGFCTRPDPGSTKKKALEQPLLARPPPPRGVWRVCRAWRATVIGGTVVALRDRARGSDVLGALAAPAVEGLAQLPQGF